MFKGSFAPADFSAVVLTCVHFQKIAQTYSLCNFWYISEGIPSLMCFWLVNDLGVPDLVHADFCQTQKKKHEPRTWCTYLETLQ